MISPGPLYKYQNKDFSREAPAKSAKSVVAKDAWFAPGTLARPQSVRSIASLIPKNEARM
jgi:hypothetical protein